MKLNSTFMYNEDYDALIFRLGEIMKILEWSNNLGLKIDHINALSEEKENLKQQLIKMMFE